MFYAGIDWADQKHDALVLDEAGHQVGSIRVPHPVDGLDKLNAWLSHMLGQPSQEQMACIIETTHWSAHCLLVGAWLASLSGEPSYG